MEHHLVSHVERAVALPFLLPLHPCCYMAKQAWASDYMLGRG